MVIDNYVVCMWLLKYDVFDVWFVDIGKLQWVNNYFVGCVWKVFVWGLMVFFLLNVMLLIVIVVVNLVVMCWFGMLLL